MSIELTQYAAEIVHAQIEKRKSGLGIRVAVKKTGCSGLAYKLEFVDFQHPDDIVFDSNNVKIHVNTLHLQYLDGVVLDYVKTPLKEEFTFINPNAKDMCGCGESFRVDEDKKIDI